MRFKKAMAVLGLGLSLTFALGACEADDDNGVNGDDDVDMTTTTLIDDTATTTAP